MFWSSCRAVSPTDSLVALLYSQGPPVPSCLGPMSFFLGKMSYVKTRVLSDVVDSVKLLLSCYCLVMVFHYVR